MARFLQWVAVLGLLCMMSLQSQAQTVSSSLQQRLNPRRVYTIYSSDGVTLNEEQVSDVITEELSDYIQEPNMELLDELMAYADVNGNGKLEVSEYVRLVNYITKPRNN